MGSPTQGMAALTAAAGTGRLDDLARRFGIRVLTVFGSTARGEPNPRDLDVGVLFEPDAAGDVLTLLAELETLTGTEVDLGVVDTGSPLFRDRALGHGTLIWEAKPGAFVVAAAMAAVERMDTAWLRRLNLEAMAG